MDCDPPFGRCETYTRNAAGEVTRSEYGDACDGTVDSCAVMRIDSRMNDVRIENDVARDGTVDCDGAPDGLEWSRQLPATTAGEPGATVA